MPIPFIYILYVRNLADNLMVEQSAIKDVQYYLIVHVWINETKCTSRVCLQSGVQLQNTNTLGFKAGGVASTNQECVVCGEFKDAEKHSPQ